MKRASPLLGPASIVTMVVLHCWAVDARAQTGADLAITGVYSGLDGNTVGPPPFRLLPTTTGGSITPTRSQTWRLTARNLGPGNASSVIVTLLTGAQVSPHLSATPDGGCALSSPTPPFNSASWVVGNLPLGSVADCTLTLSVAPTVFPQESSLVARIAAAGNTDPNASNDRSPSLFAIFSSRDFIRDMALSIRSPTGIVSNDRFSAIDFTLTNRGPGEEGFFPPFNQLLFSAPYRVGPGTDESFGFASSGDPDCEYRVSDIGQVTFVRSSELIFGPMPPGTSRTCTLLVFAAPGATGVRQLDWYNGTEGPGTFDTDISNNTATMTLQFAPAPVTAISRWGITLAAALVLCLGLVAARSIRVASSP